MSEDNAQRLTDIDHTLDLMDFDGSNDLDINEFFEVRFFFSDFILYFILILSHLIWFYMISCDAI